MGDTAILGLSFDFHDAAAALLMDGRVVGAAEQERFSRLKHDASIPAGVIDWLVSEFGIVGNDLTTVAIAGKPLTTLERVVGGFAAAGPRSLVALDQALSVWGRSKLWAPLRIERELARSNIDMPTVMYVEHHLSHAASAFYPSPFERSAIMTFDGVGEWATSSLGVGAGSDVELLKTIRYPDSLGLFYSAMTAACGFDVNDGESKLMGLAPYGSASFSAAMREHLIEEFPDGSVALNQRYFRFRAGEQMLHPRAWRILGGPPRPRHEPPGRREADIARSTQEILESVLLAAARHLHLVTGERNLCMAGGVALNCVANRALAEQSPFEDVWVQPACGDSGGAIGAALWAHHGVGGEHRTCRQPDSMQGGLLGPAYETDQVVEWLQRLGVAMHVCADLDELCRRVAESLASGLVVGWFQGRMEFGLRALGSRSILADPRDGSAIHRINGQMKRRESFRPFAPAVIEEDADRWFSLDHPGARNLARYMLGTAQVRDAKVGGAIDDGGVRDEGLLPSLGTTGSLIEACTHVDGTARVQVVSKELNPRFHRLLSQFGEMTGVPVLLNTSFNVGGEPIVRTPADALRSASGAGLDLLVIGDIVIDLIAERAATKGSSFQALEGVH